MAYLPFPSKGSSALISDEKLSKIRTAVQGHQATVIVSAKGTGKSTLVPSSLAGMANIWWTVPCEWQTDSIAEAIHINTKLSVGFNPEDEESEYFLFTHSHLLKLLIENRSRNFDWNSYGSLVIGIDDVDCMTPKNLPIITALLNYILRTFFDIRVVITCKDAEVGKSLWKYLSPGKVIGPERPLPVDSQLITWNPALLSFKSPEMHYEIEEIIINNGTDIIHEFTSRAEPNVLLVLPGVDYLPALLKKLPECLFYGTEEDAELKPINRIIKESTKPMVCIWDFYRLAPVPERTSKVCIPNKFLLKEYIPSKNIHKVHLTSTVRTPLAKPVLAMQYFLGTLPEAEDLCLFTHDSEDMKRAIYTLFYLQAINSDGAITEKGKRIVEVGQEIPNIEMAALFVDSGCPEMAAATSFDLGSGRTKKGDAMQSGLGDLHTWMNYLRTYQGSKNWCTSHCLNQANLEKAKALADCLGSSKVVITMKCIENCLGLNIAEYRNGCYVNEEGVELWIHPSSVLFRKNPSPRRVAYLEAYSRHAMPTIPGLNTVEKDYYEEDEEKEMHVKNKIYMRGVVVLDK